MSPVFHYEPQTVSDPSTLTEGMHPAMLVAITDEETPPAWEMARKSPRMWRWHLAVWQHDQAITSQQPELQSAVSSQTFSPGGRYQPSKAFVWTCALLNRAILPTESVDLEPLLPLPCQLYITRKDKGGAPIEFANIKDLVAWAGGAAHLTPDLRQKLQTWWQMKSSDTAVPGPAPAPATPQMYAPAPAPAPVTPPATRQAW